MPAAMAVLGLRDRVFLALVWQLTLLHRIWALHPAAILSLQFTWFRVPLSMHARDPTIYTCNPPASLPYALR